MLKDKRNYVNSNLYKLDSRLLESLRADFRLRFSHETTKIEGSTLTYGESKTILENGFVATGKSFREHMELVNSDYAFNYIQNYSGDITEDFIKDIHEILMTRIFSGGIYRDVNVIISGARTTPPPWYNVREEMKFFIDDYNKNKNNMDTIELAAWVHAEFVRIHPFSDGNGRTARLLLNYILISDGYLPVSIRPEDSASYYDALDVYGVDRNIKPFAEFIQSLENARLDIYIAQIKDVDFVSKMNIVKNEISK